MSDSLIKYLEDQMKLAEQDSNLLAQAMNGLIQRREQDAVNIERMRGALDKYHKDYELLKVAHANRVAELAKPPELVVIDEPRSVIAVATEE